jgi:hypothetical protein
MSSPSWSLGDRSPGSRSVQECSPPPTTTPSPRPTAAHGGLSVSQTGVLAAVMGHFYRGLTDGYLANEAQGLKARREQQQ